MYTKKSENKDTRETTLGLLSCETWDTYQQKFKIKCALLILSISVFYRL